MKTGRVEIINYNANANAIVSAAGRISTTPGSSLEVYELSCEKGDEANIKLIDKILASGHESVLEHISINLAFNNVSVFVEQFMIEFRLAAFTVKSRRYVDFGKMGYVIPASVENANDDGALRKLYCEHMDYLFSEYDFLIQNGVPKEDARFILPYSFRSNFFCTVNARELIKIMNEMVCGRGREYPELVELGQSLFRQCGEKLPYICKPREGHDNTELLRAQFPSETGKEPAGELVTLVRGTHGPERVICTAAALNLGISDWPEQTPTDCEKQKVIIKELLKNNRRRELEQVNFTMVFNKISLAGVTHLVRHRMQSILIPKFETVCEYGRYVIPESIVSAGLEDRYRGIFARSSEAAQELSQRGLDRHDGVYMLLSGMTISVMTTMNGNELCTFLGLRTCNRAQWEIKACADALLTKLRREYPLLFSMYGPNCFMKGRCPEGKMTCGHMSEVLKQYGGRTESLTEKVY